MSRRAMGLQRKSFFSCVEWKLSFMSESWNVDSWDLELILHKGYASWQLQLPLDWTQPSQLSIVQGGIFGPLQLKSLLSWLAFYAMLYSTF